MCRCCLLCSAMSSYTLGDKLHMACGRLCVWRVLAACMRVYVLVIAQYSRAIRPLTLCSMSYVPSSFRIHILLCAPFLHSCVYIFVSGQANQTKATHVYLCASHTSIIYCVADSTASAAEETSPQQLGVCAWMLCLWLRC